MLDNRRRSSPSWPRTPADGGGTVGQDRYDHPMLSVVAGIDASSRRGGWSAVPDLRGGFRGTSEVVRCSGSTSCCRCWWSYQLVRCGAGVIVASSSHGAYGRRSYAVRSSRCLTCAVRGRDRARPRTGPADAPGDPLPRAVVGGALPPVSSLFIQLLKVQRDPPLITVR
ncbi:hypothetical protein HBB16_14745 [Pseudonocardia sp. MCCB 268]|nr:hypothetical protein [Pseudonocardia cytotoxica]